MIVSPLPPIYDYFIDFIVQKATPEQVEIRRLLLQADRWMEPGS